MLSNQQSQLVGVLNDSWDTSASTPVVIQVSVLVCQDLQLIWLQATGIVDDIVASRRDCALTNRLRDEEEVVAEKK